MICREGNLQPDPFFPFARVVFVNHSSVSGSVPAILKKSENLNFPLVQFKSLGRDSNPRDPKTTGSHAQL